MMENEQLSKSQIAMMKVEKDKDNAYQEIKRYCKCGHSVYVIKQFKKVMCNYCGRYVYYDEKEEFKDKLQRKLKK